LLDERKGRAAAKARGLLTLGTLNLINLGDEAGLLDGVQALRDLRRSMPAGAGRAQVRATFATQRTAQSPGWRRCSPL
jgi:hypothetical protein